MKQIGMKSRTDTSKTTSSFYPELDTRKSRFPWLVARVDERGYGIQKASKVRPSPIKMRGLLLKNILGEQSHDLCDLMTCDGFLDGLHPDFLHHREHTLDIDQADFHTTGGIFE
jgi:hypothetical protein